MTICYKCLLGRDIFQVTLPFVNSITIQKTQKQKHMNSKIIILLMTVFSMAGISANAQTPDHERVKILATPQAGVVKLLYAQESEETLQVKFYNSDGEIALDKIKGHFPKGVMKTYDVRSIYGKSFRMEISNSRMTVVYHIIPSKDKRTFVPHLEKTIYNNELVAYNGR
jgi:hypothetical protein